MVQFDPAFDIYALYRIWWTMCNKIEYTWENFVEDCRKEPRLPQSFMDRLNKLNAEMNEVKKEGPELAYLAYRPFWISRGGTYRKTIRAPRRHPTARGVALPQGASPYRKGHRPTSR